jgi:two-component system sensor histidine kinase FlrB
MLYAENLLNNTLDPQHTQRFAGKLTARLSDLEQQVNDMLLFAKSGDGVVCKSLDAKEVVLQAMATCQAASADKQCQLHLQCDDNAEFIIKANSTALQGALQNLITNAIHASDDGATVTIAIEPVDNTIQLKVIDTGTGISADRLATIRQPFVTSKTHGTGLGLAVVDAVMKSHHGELLVQSVEGQGSCFTLVLPADTRVTNTVEQ